MCVAPSVSLARTHYPVVFQKLLFVQKCLRGHSLGGGRKHGQQRVGTLGLLEQEQRWMESRETEHWAQRLQPHGELPGALGAELRAPRQGAQTWLHLREGQLPASSTPHPHSPTASRLPPRDTVSLHSPSLEGWRFSARCRPGVDSSSLCPRSRPAGTRGGCGRGCRSWTGSSGLRGRGETE